ncbi:MAG: sporulation protein YqfD [Bariatricus sp.]
MLIAVLQYISGYLRIRVEGYSPERFINLCSYHGIYLWNLKPCGHAYEMNISVRGFRKLKPVIRKTRTKVVIMERAGFPFFLHKYRKRKLFFGGIFFCIVIIYLMSLFVWNIHIDGNLSRTDETILEFLETKGVRHGILKSKVDCDQIVKDIRKEYDDIIWVSAYVTGTRLMIRVKENTDRVIENDENTELTGADSQPTDIIADKDGLILEMITREGVPQVHEGDSVQKGDILVSGTVEILNDAKEVIGYQYHQADADIIAQTEYTYEDSLPIAYEIKKWTGNKKYSVWIETEQYLITFGTGKNEFTHKTYTTYEKRFCIGEHFWLPVTFGMDVIEEYQPVTKKYEEKEYREKLSADFQKFCLNLEKKGVQILENNVKIYSDTARASARGTLTLAEKIGEKNQSVKKELPLSDVKDTQQEGN